MIFLVMISHIMTKDPFDETTEFENHSPVYVGIMSDVNFGNITTVFEELLSIREFITISSTIGSQLFQANCFCSSTKL